MATLQERLSRALAPEYEVTEEIARGGMGIVFRGRDVRLGRDVAIKVLRPELASATAAERFLFEARALAGLSHSHVVPVHQAGEAEGLFYFVMDYIEGETLSKRLERGPLSQAETLKLGRDLLDALDAVHRAGIVHRDVKPSNIFLVGRRALLGDFGIAKALRREGEPLTHPAASPGTPEYMSPEQASGGDITIRTDLYLAGIVIYQSLTGRKWDWSAKPDRSMWSGIPAGITKVLKRALQFMPEDRWESAEDFRRALWRVRSRKYPRRTAILTGAGLVLGAVIGVTLGKRAFSAEGTPASSIISIEPFRVFSPGWDSVAGVLEEELASGLSGFADFTVLGSTQEPPSGTPVALRLRGRLSVLEDSTIQADVLGAARPEGQEVRLARATGAPSGLRAIVDSLVYQVLVAFWRERGALAEWADRVGPKSGPGLAAWVEAERLFSEARWEDAYRAYHRVLAQDSTCWLCYWRTVTTEHWLGLPHQPQIVATLLTAVDSFPPHYQTLIRASTTPMPARLDTLRSATEKWRNFATVWMVWGDKIFHRGPLVGRRRAESLEGFRMAVRLQPEFAPGWEHLAWASIAEGDSVEATEALGRYHQTAAQDRLSMMVRLLLETARAWRFEPSEQAAAKSAAALEIPGVLENPEVAAGPRFLMSFDVPEGALELGRLLALETSHPELAPSATVGQILALVSLGRISEAQGVAAQLGQSMPDAEYRLFSSELAAASHLLDGNAAVWPMKEVEENLVRLSSPGAAPTSVARRARWMLDLLGVESGRFGEAVGAGPNRASGPLQGLLDAWKSGASGEPEEALRSSEPLLALDSAGRGGDPFFRTLLHMGRARWTELLGNNPAAVRELRWHENLDVVGRPIGPPQAADVDWAFGTLARWKRATLLRADGVIGLEYCRALGDVVRLWSDGDPVPRARADSARIWLADSCPEAVR